MLSALCANTEESSHRSSYTGKERDTESGNDYFGARYYASAMGRWMSPDWAAKAMPVPYAKLDNPQSLNLYAYVLNNPLSKTDLDGHDWTKAWEAFKAAVSQTTAKVSIGLGVEFKEKIGGKHSELTVSGGMAIKENIKFSNGIESSSISGNVGVSAGKEEGKRIGAEATEEKQTSSVNLVTGETTTGGPAALEWTLGAKNGGTTLDTSGEAFSLGSEAGVGLVGGGGISITNEGVSSLKEAAGEAWSSIKEALGAAPSPTKPASPSPQP